MCSYVNLDFFKFFLYLKVRYYIKKRFNLLFCIIVTSCRYTILFATIIFPNEDEIIYFES